MGKVIKQVMEKMQDNKYEEPFFVETGINSARPKTGVSKKIDTKTKLKVMMNENITQDELEQFFDFYKKQNLKATLNEIKSQLKDQEFYKKFQQRMKSLEAVEFDDQEQVNFFLSQLCQKRTKDKLTAGKILGVNDGNSHSMKPIKRESSTSRTSGTSSSR